MKDTSNGKKTKERIKKNGEIFTPPSLVKDMVSSIPKDAILKEKTCLDPACGNGNILVSILWRKIEDGQSTLDSLRTIYGVDIMPDNVRECRYRLLRVAAVHEPITRDHIKAVFLNIVCADGLKYDFSFDGTNVNEAHIDDWMNEFGRDPEESLPVENIKSTTQNMVDFGNEGTKLPIA